jgi:hypothetical protein
LAVFALEQLTVMLSAAWKRGQKWYIEKCSDICQGTSQPF